MANVALNTMSSGMSAMQKSTEILANNISNLQTTSYKRNEANFADLIYQDEARLGTNPIGNVIVPTGIQVGLGTKLAAISRNVRQGELKQTSNSFDLAISGLGYFTIDLPDGTQAYTRAGNFTQDSQGNITTMDGNPLSPNISIPNNVTDVSISESGVVSTSTDGGATWTQQGTIQLSTFINENGLKSIGSNLLIETAASGAPIAGNPNSDNRGKLLQGWLENSNVDPITEMTSLINTQRAFELGGKVMQAISEMEREAVNIKG